MLVSQVMLLPLGSVTCEVGIWEESQFQVLALVLCQEAKRLHVARRTIMLARTLVLSPKLHPIAQPDSLVARVRILLKRVKPLASTIHIVAMIDVDI